MAAYLPPQHAQLLASRPAHLAQFFDDVGYTRTSLVNIEAGRQRLPMHQVEEIAKALGTTPRNLLKGIWL